MYPSRPAAAAPDQVKTLHAGLARHRQHVVKLVTARNALVSALGQGPAVISLDAALATGTIPSAAKPDNSRKMAEVHVFLRRCRLERDLLLEEDMPALLYSLALWVQQMCLPEQLPIAAPPDKYAAGAVGNDAVRAGCQVARRHALRLARLRLQDAVKVLAPHVPPSSPQLQAARAILAAACMHSDSDCRCCVFTVQYIQLQSCMWNELQQAHAMIAHTTLHMQDTHPLHSATHCGICLNMHDVCQAHAKECDVHKLDGGTHSGEVQRVTRWAWGHMHNTTQPGCPT